MIGVLALGGRPLPRSRARQGAEPALRRASGSTCRRRDRLRRRARSSSRSLVGIVVTLIAAIRPALRATRVPPIAAVREGAVLPTSRFARFRPSVALVVIVRRGRAHAHRAVRRRLSTKAAPARDRRRRRRASSSASRCSRRRSCRRSRACSAGRRARFGGAAGHARARQRDAQPAAHRLDGVRADDRPRARHARLRARRRAQGDVRETPSTRSSPPTTRSRRRTASRPSSIASEQALAGAGRRGRERRARRRRPRRSAAGSASPACRADDQQGDRRRSGSAGSPATPGELGSDGAFVAKATRRTTTSRRLADRRSRRRPATTLHLKLRGIFDPPKGGSPFGDVTISTQRFDREYPNPQNVFAFVNIAGGVTAANTARAHRRRSRTFPDAKIQTKARVQEAPGAGINTAAQPALRAALALDHHQPVRDREHARADGVRADARARDAARRRHDAPPGAAMIRHESIITALIGAALGIPRRDRARAHGRQGDRLSGVHDPVGHARRVRHRRDHRRPRRRDLPGAARREA